MEQWRQYLQHSEFSIYTDHRSLAHLSDQRLHTPWQQRVFTKLLGLQYKIIYKKGVDNGVADALSRRPHDESMLFSISSGSPQWLHAVVDGYSEDPKAQHLLTTLSLQPSASGHYSLQSGVIKYKGRVWLGANHTLQQQVISALHDSPIGGHSGFPVTYRRVKQLFAWSGLKQTIKDYVSSCNICHQVKPDRQRYPGLLQPLPVPDQAWQIISLDFIEGLPRSGPANCILVVVDTFSKYAHFIGLLHPFSALKVAKVFLSSVYRLHGLPEAIISDRDKIFTSTLWQELFRLTGTKLQMSTAYHPQSDGQTERVNQCLETFLRSFVHSCPAKWNSWLPLAEFWYNTCTHSALKVSPFEALYGRPPRHFGLTPSDAVSHPDLATWLENRELMLKSIKQHLLRAKQRMKHQADKGRSEREFAVGDSVYVKLQPYVQTSVATRANHKLSFKYFGPFEITQRIGTVAYKLNLPESSSIHPVFHVSQLKQSVKSTLPVSATLPSTTLQLQFPEQVLDRRTVSRGGSSIDQILVRWSGLEDVLATWEDEEALKAKFPAATAWGQAASQGEGLSAPVHQRQQECALGKRAVATGGPTSVTPAQSGTHESAQGLVISKESGES